MAAELIEAGVEPHRVYARIYESLPFERITLLQRALATIRRFDDGTITMLHLTADDFEQTGAVENDSEGIIDHARAVEGTAVAVLVRASARSRCAPPTAASTSRRSRAASAAAVTARPPAPRPSWTSTR
jgi:phosphoesterase RecJ-like protein